jgi:hypothetical protein
MYPYLIISIDIEIHSIFLEICVLHWDTCHNIGICDSALGHDMDTTSSHMPHGPLIFILLVQLDIVLTFMHYYFLLGPPHVRAIDAFEEVVTGCWSGYRQVD